MTRDLKVAHSYLKFLRTQFRNKSKLTVSDQYTTYHLVNVLFPDLTERELSRDWINEFDKRLHDRGFAPNTIWKHHKNMKVYVNYLLVMDAFPRSPYIGFESKQYQGVKIVVTEAEIASLEKFDLPPAVRLYRDMFLASFYTLLRKSDVERLCKDHIQEINGRKYVKINTKKTGQQVIMPANDRLIALISRLDPKRYDDTALNQSIRTAFQLAGLNRKIELMDYVTKNGTMEKVYRQVALCDVVTIHAARRSGITAMVRAGLPTRSIMFISGWSISVIRTI